MTIVDFLQSLLSVLNAKLPYLLLGFLIAGVLHVFVPKRFYSRYLSRDNKLSVLWVALLGVPLPLCSCGVIPTAVGLKNDWASKGAVASFLIATPQTGIASILVVHKSMGSRFTWIYLLTIVGFSILFGLLVNAIGLNAGVTPACDGAHGACCPAETPSVSWFRTLCSVLLVLFIIIALGMKLFDKFKKKEAVEGTTTYTVEGMHCNHCKAAVEQAVGNLRGVESCEATPAANTLVVTGTASEKDICKAVEQAGFEFKEVKE